MRSARTITLFSERADVGQGSSSFVGSLLAHTALIALIYLGIAYGPKVKKPGLSARYTLRHLDLNSPEQHMPRPGGSGIGYPGAHSSAHGTQQAKRTDAQQPILRQAVKAALARQTIVQPDLPPSLKPPLELPVPALVIWSSHKTPPPTIVPPPPAKPVAAQVRPTMVRPTEEVRLADVAVPAATLPSSKLPILPSTTSPVLVHGPQLPQKAPSTTSVSTAKPTPTAVLSLSDTHMPKGTVVLPPVNESAAASSPGALEPGAKPAKESTPASNGSASSHATGTSGKTSPAPGEGNAKGENRAATGAGKEGAGQSAGNAKGQSNAAGNAGNGSGPKGGPGEGAGEGSGSGSQSGTRHLTLPKDGQFGSVVVGASLEDKYPEMSGTWSGRVAYTVYLRVGQPKSWILQYSLPRADNTGANSTRLDAPWPFNEVVPVINPDTMDADALMVHGFINQTGRFEGLAMVFPPDFPQAKFILDALRQWQFRPAMQNGQSARVEVLLIVPAQPE